MRVYCSGPMQLCDDEQTFGWRRRAVAALGDVMDVFVPNIDMPRNDEEIALMVESDKWEIDHSDFVLVNPWKFSAGTAMEQLYAWERGKIVVLVEGDGSSISPWHRYHAHYVVRDESTAHALLRDLLSERLP
jgi:nucleoside 2-deoxyribosyltransferase